MKTYKFKLEELFQLESLSKFDFPFNIKFSRRYKNTINGPGIYLIILEDQIAYLGRYRTENDIMNDRWSKHIQTMTNRGYNVGFNRSLERFKLVYEEVYNQNNLIINKSELLNKRLRDTGVVTAKNKVKFCMDNWSKFKDIDNNCNLHFHLFKPDIEHKEFFINNIAELEKQLIFKINPPANAQYANSRQILDIGNAIKCITEAMVLIKN